MWQQLAGEQHAVCCALLLLLPAAAAACCTLPAALFRDNANSMLQATSPLLCILAINSHVFLCHAGWHFRHDWHHNVPG
jgi:hypothetical protein